MTSLNKNKKKFMKKRIDYGGTLLNGYSAQIHDEKGRKKNNYTALKY